MVLDDWEVTEEVADAGKEGRPEQSTQDVVNNEGLVVHLAAPGNERHEGPDEGDETADHDGDGAMSFKELLRCQPVVFIDQLVEPAVLGPGSD